MFNLWKETQFRRDKNILVYYEYMLFGFILYGSTYRQVYFLLY